MSLQRRLTLFFVVMVILPLAAAALVVQRMVVDEIGQRSVLALDPSLDATLVLYNDQVDVIDERVQAAVGSYRFATLLDEGRSKAITDYLNGLLDEEGIDFVVALDGRGRPLGFVARPPSFLPGVETPTPQEILQAPAGTADGFARTPPISVRIAGRGEVGSVVGGFWLDEDLLVGSTQDRMELSIVSAGRVIATTAPLDRAQGVDLAFDRSFDLEMEGHSTARARRLPGEMAVVASTPTAPIDAQSRRVLVWMVGLLVLALAGTSVLAYILAKLITQPLHELAEGARAIAEGRFGRQIPVRSKDEVGELGRTFNEMSVRLQQTISQLSSSRDQLQKAIHRVGETLRSTHDMKQMLGSILHTSADAVAADDAVIWMFTPSRNELYPAVSKGTRDLSGHGHTVKVGEGIVGLVVERGSTITIPRPTGSPNRAPNEPALPVSISLPLYSQHRAIGVLSVYRRDVDNPFTQEDLHTLEFLAEQGGVAIENVQLHEEAQRLSLTDGLTGIWNRRYFQIQFKQVLATATRFGRPFSILMMDLDHFKRVNDTYGHQRGDEILQEASRRIARTLREIDTFARYGGEEFVCLLTETDVAGAMTTAEKIREAIKTESFPGLSRDHLYLTISIGVAAFPDHGTSFRSLIEAADRGLYEAKQSGRDQVRVAHPPPAGLKLAT